MKTLIFDTETTGKHEPQIIEAAFIQVAFEGLIILDELKQRYKPSKLIELGAIATHHILDEELEHCPSHTEFSLPADTQYIIGHNVDYDWKVAGEPNIKRICTLALARTCLPDLDSHTQSALVYYFARHEARDLLKNAHSALADVENCLLVLKGLLKIIGEVRDWEHLWELSEKARIPKVMPFGKHKGELIDDVPADYKRWLMRQSDIDPYLRKALT